MESVKVEGQKPSSKWIEQRKEALHGTSTVVAGAVEYDSGPSKAVVETPPPSVKSRVLTNSSYGISSHSSSPKSRVHTNSSCGISSDSRSPKSPRGSYGLGHTRATMAITMGIKALRQNESGKIASVQIVLCNSGIPRASSL
ncbi:hypothetical protein LguiA_033512 [Lonicera macranthoides]